MGFLTLIGGVVVVTTVAIIGFVWLAVAGLGAEQNPPLQHVYKMWLYAIGLMSLYTVGGGIVQWLTSVWNLLL